MTPEEAVDRPEELLLDASATLRVALACDRPEAGERERIRDPERLVGVERPVSGIAHSMQLDYGDLAADARLVQLQAWPRPKC